MAAKKGNLPLRSLSGGLRQERFSPVEKHDIKMRLAIAPASKSRGNDQASMKFVEAVEILPDSLSLINLAIREAQHVFSGGIWRVELAIGQT